MPKIAATVGVSQTNNPSDVVTVQSLLNRSAMPSMRRAMSAWIGQIRSALVAACLLLAASGAGAATLAPGAAPGALAAAAKGASGPGFSQATTMAAQSFRVMNQGKLVGTLVSGRGTLPALAADASPVQGCFVALVKAGGATTVVPTIGAGDWEAETCNGVAAVGLLPDEGGASRAGLVYRTTAPHESPLEPVVVTWSETLGLAIDAAATRRASLAGADSLATLRAAVK